MEDLAPVLALPEGVERTAALVAWVQGLFAPGPPPVLVGGAAVELYTGGAYTTGDLDLVGTVPAAVARALRQAGFRKQGRHWIHDAGEIFLEFPSSSLHEGEEGIAFRAGPHEVLILAAEDLIAERLAAWQHWRSAVDGVNGWLVYAARRASLDDRRLARQVTLRRSEAGLRALKRLARVAARRQLTTADVERWALRGP